MILLINKATRLSDYFLRLSKEYTAVIRFGLQTDSMDCDGKVIEKTGIDKLDSKKLSEILEGFTGTIRQVPPMFSALKYKGSPLYKLARKGVEVPREPREVKIHNIEVISIEGRDATVKIGCSSGTYIRVLAHDIGNAYGSGAMLESLRRTGIGDMSVEDSCSVDNIIGTCSGEQLPQDMECIRSIDKLFSKGPHLYIKEEYVDKVRNGSRICRSMLDKSPALRSDAKESMKPLKGLTDVRTVSGELVAIHALLPENGDKDFTKSVIIF